MTEIIVRVVGWSLAAAVAVPTVAAHRPTYGPAHQVVVILQPPSARPPEKDCSESGQEQSQVDQRQHVEDAGSAVRLRPNMLRT